MMKLYFPQGLDIKQLKEAGEKAGFKVASRSDDPDTVANAEVYFMNAKEAHLKEGFNPDLWYLAPSSVLHARLIAKEMGGSSFYEGSASHIIREVLCERIRGISGHQGYFDSYANLPDIIKRLWKSQAEFMEGYNEQFKPLDQVKL